MNVCELLRLLRVEHDETAAGADNQREQIKQFTTALAETGARLAEPAAEQSASVYQRIVTVFNEYPGKVFRVRDRTNTLACPPTRWSAKGAWNNPHAANIRNGLDALSQMLTQSW